jgi:hypothetical protein
MSWSAFQIAVASGAAALLLGSFLGPLGYTMSRAAGKARRVSRRL